MDNHLPKRLWSLIVWIVNENDIQSWRMYEEKNIILSIRFKSKSAISDLDNCVQPTVTSDQPSIYYRSKPPSAIHRDYMRRQQWINGATCVSTPVNQGVVDSRYGNPTYTKTETYAAPPYNSMQN